jgi:3-oxoadipyl-CoA thiolase
VADAFLVSGVRTPIGRYGGSLASVRPDDMAGHAIRELMRRFPAIAPEAIEEVAFGCANQAGEDNRNVGRMALLLAGLPDSVPAATINRLCGSGLDAVGYIARAIRCGEFDLAIAGGVESMTRAPFVMGKAGEAFARQTEIYDTTIGWRFINPVLKAQYGVDAMTETAENVAEEFQISRADQDAFAFRSQTRALAAQASGRLAREIAPVTIPQRKGDPVVVGKDEHPRATTLDKLAALPTPFRKNGTVTAGNSSGVNDGAAALLIASKAACERYNLTPLARIVSMATAGVAPRIMGIGPVPATRRLLERAGLSVKDIDLFELNEAFAAQSLACTRQLGLRDDESNVNPNGGAISLGHPLGMSGARLALTAAIEMEQKKLRRAVCTMCVGVGQGIALLLEAP